MTAITTNAECDALADDGIPSRCWYGLSGGQVVAGTVDDPLDVKDDVPNTGIGGDTVGIAGCGEFLALLREDGTVWSTHSPGDAPPAPVQGLTDVTTIVSGLNWILAVTRSGSVYEVFQAAQQVAVFPLGSPSVPLVTIAEWGIALDTAGHAWAWPFSNEDSGPTPGGTPQQLVGPIAVSAVGSDLVFGSDHTIWQVDNTSDNAINMKNVTDQYGTKAPGLKSATIIGASRSIWLASK